MDQQELNTAFYEAQEGDSTAFAKIFNAFWHMAYYNCFKLLRNERDAESAVQEVFFILHKRIADLKSPAHLANGVKSYVLEVCSGFYKKRKRISADMLLSLDDLNESTPALKEEFLPAYVLGSEELKAKILEQVNNLPKKQHDILFNYYFNDFSAEEISKVSGISINSVGLNLDKARKKLSTLVKGQVDSGRAASPASAPPVLTQIFTEEMNKIATFSVKESIVDGIELRFIGESAGGSQTGIAGQTATGSKKSIGSKLVAGIATLALTGGIVFFAFSDSPTDAGESPPEPPKVVDIIEDEPEEEKLAEPEEEKLPEPEEEKLPEPEEAEITEPEEEEETLEEPVIEEAVPANLIVTIKYYKDEINDAGYLGTNNDAIIYGRVLGTIYTITDDLRDKNIPGGYKFNSMNSENGTIRVAERGNVIRVLYTPLDNLTVTIEYYKDTMDSSGFMGENRNEIVGDQVFGTVYEITSTQLNKNLPADYKFERLEPASGGIRVAESGNVIKVLYTEVIVLETAIVSSFSKSLDNKNEENLQFVVSITLSDKNTYEVKHYEKVNDASKGNKFFVYNTVYGNYTVYAEWNDDKTVTVCEVRGFVPIT